MNSALNTLLFFGWIISLIVFFGNKASGPPAGGDGGSYRNNFSFSTGTNTFGAMFPAPAVPWHREQNFRTTF